MSGRFQKPGDRDTVEAGTAFTPRFDGGLVTCVVADAADGEVLMLAHMNEEALARTIETGEAWFWSRSRGALWRKGESSGNRLQVVELRVDCDQDALLMQVKVTGDGVACHTGRRSCFYRTVPLGKTGAVTLQFHDAGKTSGPKTS